METKTNVFERTVDLLKRETHYIQFKSAIGREDKKDATRKLNQEYRNIFSNILNINNKYAAMAAHYATKDDYADLADWREDHEMYGDDIENAIVASGPSLHKINEKAKRFGLAPIFEEHDMQRIAEQATEFAEEGTKEAAMVQEKTHSISIFGFKYDETKQKKEASEMADKSGSHGGTGTRRLPKGLPTETEQPDDPQPSLF